MSTTISQNIARLQGPNLVLRLITTHDAAYIHGLRTDPVYCRYVSPVHGTVHDQALWIEAYKAREADGREYYFAIERHDGVRCGLVRLYDITQHHFTWGSWILDHNKPRKAALESAILSFGVGFDLLGCERAQVDVRVENEHAAAFYVRLGMTEIRRTPHDILFEYSRARFRADLALHHHLLVAAANNGNLGQ